MRPLREIPGAIWHFIFNKDRSEQYVALAPHTIARFELRKRRFDYPPTSPNTRLTLLFSYLSIYLFMGILGIIGLILSFVSNQNDLPVRLTDYNLMYPNRDQIVGNGLSIVLSVAVPLAILVFAQIFVRNFHDLHHAIIGLILSLLFALNFVSFMWVVFSGYRPKFLSDCQVIKERIVPGRIWYQPSEICANYQSYKWTLDTPAFPSGHSAHSFAPWVFLALYLNAKLNVFDGRAHIWKLVLSWFTLFVPLFIAGSRYRDFSHDLFQIIVGMILGVLAAHAAYPLTYCSLYGIDSHVPTFYLWKRRSSSTDVKTTQAIQPQQQQLQTGVPDNATTHVMVAPTSGDQHVVNMV